MPRLKKKENNNYEFSGQERATFKNFLVQDGLRDCYMNKIKKNKKTVSTTRAKGQIEVMAFLATLEGDEDFKKLYEKKKDEFEKKQEFAKEQIIQFQKDKWEEHVLVQKELNSKNIQKKGEKASFNELYQMINSYQNNQLQITQHKFEEEKATEIIMNNQLVQPTNFDDYETYESENMVETDPCLQEPISCLGEDDIQNSIVSETKEIDIVDFLENSRYLDSFSFLQ
jgi:hypothetical protein